MTRTADARRLEIGATYNFRDVGGYALAGGGRTAWGRLFRSDLPRLAVDDATALRALGLRMVLDLRDDAECESHPACLGGVEVRVVRRPLRLAGLLEGLRRQDEDPLGTLYRTAARELGAEIAAAVAVLAGPGALPALVHCAAGKDRTGIVVALALSAVGVPDDLVAADFALSSSYLSAGYFDQFRNRAAGDVSRTSIDPVALRGSEPASMLRLLAEVHEQYGGALDYLRQHGVTDEELTTLRQALIAPDADVPEERA
jgi:protein-tyrosine phosphatase